MIENVNCMKADYVSTEDETEIAIDNYLEEGHFDTI